MKDVKEFLLNLSDDDIDIVNKLDNMYGSEITDEKLYERLAKDKDIQSAICENVRFLVKKDIDDVSEEVTNETRNLFEDGLIDTEDDYTAGLYNMDGLYVQAIEMILGD